MIFVFRGIRKACGAKGSFSSLLNAQRNCTSFFVIYVIYALMQCGDGKKERMLKKDVWI
jgi:hypothetical protein